MHAERHFGKTGAANGCASCRHRDLEAIFNKRLSTAALTKRFSMRAYIKQSSQRLNSARPSRDRHMTMQSNAIGEHRVESNRD
jgi:hypothetical protein